MLACTPAGDSTTLPVATSKIAWSCPEAVTPTSWPCSARAKNDSAWRAPPYVPVTLSVCRTGAALGTKPTMLRSPSAKAALLGCSVSSPADQSSGLGSSQRVRCGSLR
jgi:hypothetical protein